VCTTCSRHIKAIELSCPFCNAPHATSSATPLRALPRLSRAHWLVLGSSLAVAGCSGAIAPTSTGDADASKDLAQQAQAAGDDAAAEDADASLAEDAGPAIVVDYDAAYTYDSAYHGCYGSPPARLERIARTS
jgi:hypothetical protein